MEYFLAINVALAIVMTQFYLSRRKHVYLGGIIPLLFVLVTLSLWLLEVGLTNLTAQELIKVLLLASLVLLSIWANGRKSLKAKASV
ncbi:hypothetical protein [Aquisalibacillus elongatus]|uniref:Uncharacterized protein n=1 Tax=Aquisalibacillus elongatus TaxID=485577 RepID=A0A3N5B8Y1_9BACI|nr:hypothetical protein [Aquisalibacillus elongatus]RPF53924.1 hypothetical protein EDC24_1109 [Aquisalibacillus elongatus]